MHKQEATSESVRVLHGTLPQGNKKPMHMPRDDAHASFESETLGIEMYNIRGHIHYDSFYCRKANVIKRVYAFVHSGECFVYHKHVLAMYLFLFQLFPIGRCGSHTAGL